MSSPRKPLEVSKCRDANVSWTGLVAGMIVGLIVAVAFFFFMWFTAAFISLYTTDPNLYFLIIGLVAIAIFALFSISGLFVQRTRVTKKSIA